MRHFPFVFIPIFVSGFFIWLGYGQYSKGRVSESWPTASGLILNSDVAEARTRAGSAQRMYEARIIYEYEIGGQKYKGNQVTFADGSSSNRSDASKMVNQMPAGKTVPVYYNPADPYEACLIREVGKMPWLMMGGGLIGMVLSVKTLLFGSSVRRRRHIQFS